MSTPGRGKAPVDAIFRMVRTGEAAWAASTRTGIPKAPWEPFSEWATVPHFPQRRLGPVSA